MAPFPLQGPAGSADRAQEETRPMDELDPRWINARCCMAAVQQDIREWCWRVNQPTRKTNL